MIILKNLQTRIGDKRTLIFLDLEGTQFSHEMIAFGAIKVTLNEDYSVKKEYQGIKRYVLAHHSIGRIVRELTGLNEEMIAANGISFYDAIEDLKEYCLSENKKVLFITYGTHDLRIIARSMEESPEADKDFCEYILHNTIDLSAVLAQYVRDENGNPLSLIHALEAFDITMSGEPHDPLVDAKHLLLIYQALLEKKEKLLILYEKTLRNWKALPLPIHIIIQRLIDGKDVTHEEFIDLISAYIK